MRLQFLKGNNDSNVSVQKALKIRKAIRKDVFGRIEKWGKVNYVWCALDSTVVHAGKNGIHQQCSVGSEGYERLEDKGTGSVP